MNTTEVVELKVKHRAPPNFHRSCCCLVENVSGSAKGAQGLGSLRNKQHKKLLFQLHHQKDKVNKSVV